jgi:hypothetical protein
MHTANSQRSKQQQGNGNGISLTSRHVSQRQTAEEAAAQRSTKHCVLEVH